METELEAGMETETETELEAELEAGLEAGTQHEFDTSITPTAAESWFRQSITSKACTYCGQPAEVVLRISSLVDRTSDWRIPFVEENTHVREACRSCSRTVTRDWVRAREL